LNQHFVGILNSRIVLPTNVKKNCFIITGLAINLYNKNKMGWTVKRSLAGLGCWYPVADAPCAVETNLKFALAVTAFGCYFCQDLVLMAWSANMHGYWYFQQVCSYLPIFLWFIVSPLWYPLKRLPCFIVYDITIRLMMIKVNSQIRTCYSNLYCSLHYTNTTICSSEYIVHLTVLTTEGWCATCVEVLPAGHY